MPKAWEKMAMDRLCRQLAIQKKGILKWHTCQISTGPLEGFKNKIKVLKRPTYGYRDDEYLNLPKITLHQYRYALWR
jgi:transposase